MISFIVPIYNVEKYLERCVDSVLHGGSDEFEMILVDDGSNDSSGSICDRYAQEYKNIKVIHKNNGGLSEARNAGIKVANGDYLFFLDSDDYIIDNSIIRLNKLLVQNSGIDILFLNVRVIEKTKETIWKKNNVLVGQSYTGIDFLKAELSSGNFKAMAPIGVYRRSFILENELYFKKGILHEDEQWSPRVIAFANRVLVLNEICYIYEIRDGSITQKKDKTKNALDLMDTCVELKEYFSQTTDKQLQRLENRYLAKLYMGAVTRGLFQGDQTKVMSKCTQKFVINCGITFSDKFRMYIFSISPKLYAQIFKQLYV